VRRDWDEWDLDYVALPTLESGGCDTAPTDQVFDEFVKQVGERGGGGGGGRGWGGGGGGRMAGVVVWVPLCLSLHALALHTGRHTC